MKDIITIFVSIMIFICISCSNSDEPENTDTNAPCTYQSTQVCADIVIAYNPLNENVDEPYQNPDLALGHPKGKGEQQGSTDVVCLGDLINGEIQSEGGNIILSFSKYHIINGSGIDFKVFENTFTNYDGKYIEVARVSVSDDNVNYYEFPVSYNENYPINDIRRYESGFCGVNPVYANSENCEIAPSDANSGGDAFDIDVIIKLYNLPVDFKPKYVKITDAGSKYEDVGNDLKYLQRGVDIDAVCIMNYEEN